MKILPYSVENLAKALSNEYTSSEVISSKNHFIYLKDYFGSSDIDAKSIVIEENYVSKDFLHDYASYYALCFEPYPKICKRVHFFKSSFTEVELKASLIDANVTANFWNSYLGFIVIKPIPVTVIGYTVLKTYSSKQAFDERNFWGIREYVIHFHGTEIKIKSLAFQEQDSVLAACATTAIWSMLNKAAIDFHTILKSPSQITKDADNVSPDGSRLFPNKGLNLLQICQAIFNSGLVSEVKQPDYILRNSSGEPIGRFVSNSYLKKILNAYSPIGIPIILVIKVPNGGDHGLHAITVSGFKQSAPKPIPPQTQISWLSDSIEKFYAHDDQWGPFARVEFKNEIELKTPWTVFDPNQKSTLISNIVVSIYPKIRISYEDIEVIVLGIDRILSFFFNNQNIADLVWDIKIDFSENFKKQIKHSALEQNEKISRLTQSLPKYLWVASCYIASHKVFEFTFDATDVKNGMIGKDLICYLPNEIKPVLVNFLAANKAILQSLFNHRASHNYYQFLIDRLSI
ncbi:hypothetical protein FAM09_01310 [Niastella caeni]|uniref:Uncharacterized protein n=1 Tax=Niastella caeni TaxID=2569763 RepID=A0A4S8HYA4_9BACT|nr:hypothetical protein [Niastella caeni]THU40778.1 hypothetical protein FAM09_01310 [Niastella caeni]